MLPLPKPLRFILSLDGFNIFIEGKKGSGKTNIAILLLELCREYGLRTRFASNIEIYEKPPEDEEKRKSYVPIEYINNYPDLEKWLKEKKGRKLYVLDEAGKHMPRLRFMSTQNVKIMQTVQLVRHYDGGLILIAPSSKLVDSNFMNTDLLDARIRKLGNKKRTKKIAKVIDIYNGNVYFLYDLPKTSIKHNSKTDAIFTMEKKVDLKTLPWCCQVSRLYAKTGSYKIVANNLNIHPEQVKREVLKHLKHA